MVNEDVEFRDEIDGGMQEQTLSIKEIVLRQIRKIGDISCKEFTGGYWEKKPMRTSSGIMFSEVYHDDVREAYCNAVDFLIDIVYPMGDDILKNYLKDFEDFKENIIKEDQKDEVKIEIGQKIKLKRQTFRQINLMFDRTNIWKGVGSYNE
ncbi:MAG: hypothetical protein M0R03_23570 [Novosphingobium sp.]|nr:hypothetical protein [Novosphingobium sp.]